MLLPFGRYYFKSYFVISGWCYCLLIFYCIGRCYCQWLVADVIPPRLMLLPIICVFYIMADIITIVLADVITTFYLIYIWLMLLPCVCGRCYYHWGWCCCLLCLYFGWCYCQYSGRCYGHWMQCVGWWYCQMADGIATVGWRMLSGWCYYHWADVIALGQYLF